MAITATEAPNSQEVTRSAGAGRVVVKRYTYRHDDNWEAEMPALGATVAGLGYVISYDGKPRQDGQYVDVAVKYGALSNYTPSDTDTVYDFDCTDMEKDIELHPDFLMKWKYSLWAITATSDTPPAWFNTATDASDADGITYLWSIDHPGDGWKRLGLRTKPGLETYLCPSATVRRRDYYASRASAVSARREVAEIETPGEAFGVTGGSWLIRGCRLVVENGLWVADTSYLHSAEGWDTDVYAAAS